MTVTPTGFGLGWGQVSPVLLGKCGTRGHGWRGYHCNTIESHVFIFLLCEYIAKIWGDEQFYWKKNWATIDVTKLIFIVLIAWYYISISCFYSRIPDGFDFNNNRKLNLNDKEIKRRARKSEIVILIVKIQIQFLTVWENLGRGPTKFENCCCWDFTLILHLIHEPWSTLSVP